MEIEFKGFDKLMNRLKSLKQKIESIEGENYVLLKDLLNPSFLIKHTKYPNLDELFKASGFKVESQDDYKNIPDDEWDEFISKNTKFRNWEEMLTAAASDWTIKQLNL